MKKIRSKTIKKRGSVVLTSDVNEYTIDVTTTMVFKSDIKDMTKEGLLFNCMNI